MILFNKIYLLFLTIKVLGSYQKLFEIKYAFIKHLKEAKYFICFSKYINIILLCN